MRALASVRVALAALGLLLAATPALAQERAGLKERFEQRYRVMVGMKDAGKVGETWLGFLAAVEPEHLKETAVKRLVDEENADRRRLYELLAADLRRDLPKEKRAGVTAATVGRRNAQRNIGKAKPGHYLMMAAGTWIQKKDEARYRKLLDYKKSGYVGETWEGLVEIVTAPSAQTRALAAIVAQENEVRMKRYAAIAKRRGDATAAGVGREKAKGYLEGARPDDFYKTAEEGWQRKKDLPKS